MLGTAKKWAAKRIVNQMRLKTWSHYWSANPGCSDEEIQSRFPELSVAGKTRLCVLMDKYGSDKGAGWHNYTKVYHQLFKGLCIENVFEMGIGTTNIDIKYNMGSHGTPGASLYAWRAYFQNANIFSADIDPGILINHERIESYHCDQTSPESIRNLWNQPSVPSSFDVMIDDGLHEFEGNCTLFENSAHRIRKGGIYIVEDINSFDLGSWKARIESDYLNRYPNLLFRLCCVPNVFNIRDNNLLIIYAL